MDTASSEREAVELSIPLGSDLLVLARFTAGVMATRAGFDLEEIDDLRLAVDELCVLLVHDRLTGRLLIDFSVDDGAVEVECRHEPGSEHAPAEETAATAARGELPEGLSERILDALVDEHGTRTDGASERVWLRKRRSAS